MMEVDVYDECLKPDGWSSIIKYDGNYTVLNRC